MLGAGVPETAIDEDRHSHGRKGNVGPNACRANGQDNVFPEAQALPV
jgi:hypothetical protein